MGGEIKINGIIYGTSFASGVTCDDEITVQEKLSNAAYLSTDEEIEDIPQGNYLYTTDIIDNLESESDTHALNANQGRILNEKFEFNQNAKSIIYDNINSGLEATNTQAAVDELNSKLGGLTFTQDAEGNWGYLPSGADTVIPFKFGSGENFNFVYKEANMKTGLSIDTTNELYVILFAYDGRKYNSSTYGYDYLYSEPKEQILNIFTLTNGTYDELGYTEYSIPGYVYTPDIGETVDGTYVACVGRLVFKCIPTEGATMSFSVPMAIGEMGGGFVFEKTPIE